MPPASASRSMTRTSPSTCGASPAAAVRPAGPPPMMATATCSSAGGFMTGPLAGGCGGLERFVALVPGQGPDVGVADLAGGDAFAEADDAAVFGIAVDQAGVLVRPGKGLAEVGHRGWRGQA